MSVPMLIPTDCLAAISGQTNGRCSLYFGELLADDALKLLHLYVDLFKAERETAAQHEDDRWEWG